MNPIIENIQTRRSVRSYLPQSVEREKLEVVLNSGCYAPYGLTTENRLFTALQGEKLLSQANNCIRDCLQSIPVTPQTHPYIKNLIEKSKEKEANFFYHAPVLIILSMQKDHPIAMADCAAAAQNMMLAAHSLGLGTCWLNQLPGLTQIPRLRQWMDELQFPEEHLIFVTFVLGYPAKETKNSHLLQVHNNIRIL